MSRRELFLSERKKDAWAFLVFMGLIVVFYGKVLFGGAVFTALDCSRFFFPLWRWGAAVFGQGIIPLWNPDAQFGVPYLADPQMACAYPPLWILYACLGPVAAFSAVIVLHHFWALLGFWTFARGGGFSGRTSFLGSLAFGFSLHLVGSSWTPPALMAISWLPWVFWSAQKVFQKDQGGFLLLSSTWAMQLACGYPVLAYLTGLALGMHYGWKSLSASNETVGAPLRGHPGQARRPAPTSLIQRFFWVSRFALAALIAAAYNLAWGLPFAEMLPLTNYAAGAERFHDLGWKALATFLIPFPQGHPLAPHGQETPYWVGTYFLGLPAACLLIWGMFQKAYRGTSLWLFAALLALSLGSLGTGKFLRAVLPGYSLVVHSGFWISILTLYGVWMAMEAMEKILREGPRAGRWVWGALVLTTILALGPSGNSLLLTKENSYYKEPPKVLGVLKESGRLFFTPPEMTRAMRLQGGNVGEAYEGAKQKFYPNWPLSFGREEAPFYNTIQLKNTSAWTFGAFQRSEEFSRQVLDYLSVRYLFGHHKFKNMRRMTGLEVPVELSENLIPMPKWFFVSKAVVSGLSLEEDFSRAAKAEMDLSKECFIADPSKAGAYGPRVVSQRPIRNPNRILLSASGEGRALLVSSETAFPGWNVLAVGGEEHRLRPVEQVNHAFLGIILEPNESLASLSYEPVTFRLGFFILLLVLGGWMGSFFKLALNSTRKQRS